MDTSAGGRTATKRAVTVLLVVTGWLVSAGLGAATVLAQDSPVLAESFESGAALPAGWRFIEFTQGASTATSVSGAAADGTHFLRIVSSQPNHARVMAPVQVTPNTNYRFQAMVKATGVNAGAAAVLGADGQVAATDSVRTDTQWQPLDLYVKVGQQTTINVTMGLGHFGELNLGTADFDAVTVTQVSGIPNGAKVADLSAAAAAAEKPETAAEGIFTQSPNTAIWVFVGILVGVSTGAAVFLVLRGDRAPRTDAEPDDAGTIEPRRDSPTDAEGGAQPEGLPDRAG